MIDMIKTLQSIFRERTAPSLPACTALVLSGGGARAAYQAGVLQFISDRITLDPLGVITGVSAGSINAAQLANHVGNTRDAVAHLVGCWSQLTPEDVYEPESSFSVMMSMMKRSSDHDQELLPRTGLVDTTPLQGYLRKVMGAEDGRLSGIATNIEKGALKACALVGTEYATGRSVTWIEGDPLTRWERPRRISKQVHLKVDHIMASSSLPFLFPAIKVGDAWYGDGGIRQVEPLSPAVHLGATKILAVSTRYGSNSTESAVPVVVGYPPAAQIFGVLLNAVFLDRLDQDAAGMVRINELIRHIPPSSRQDLRPIDLLVIRPSRDLGKLSGDFQHDLSGVLKLIGRGLGSKDTKSPDWLSMILFEPAYTTGLIDVGYQDARNQYEELARFFDA